jgi:myo-inositol 2-dehydrogenase / D-chiro-inositol 1-dehydrogenase
MNRRAFLHGATMAGLAPIMVSAQSNAESVRTGMIGTGLRGQHTLGKLMKQPGVTLAALCDLKPDRLDKAASITSRDNPKTYREYRKLLDQKDLDAVFIDTPCHLHSEMAIAALQAGKNVYCEKPIGINPKQVQELLKAARASKKVFQAGQQMRSFSWLGNTIAKIHEGVAGQVVMVKAQRHSSWDLDHNGSSADWFFDASRSGDVIVEMAVHNLDLCNWAANSRPAKASGFGGTLIWKNDPPGRTNMDGYTLSYEYANGVKMSFTQNFFHPSGLPSGGQYANVYGTKGAVSLDNGKFYPLERGKEPVVLSTPEREDDAPHFAAFFNAIRTGAKSPAGIEIGATAALTAILGREAIYTGKMMSWNDLGVEI